MRKVLTFLLLCLATEIIAQNKKTVFYDSIGERTTWGNYWTQIATAKYKTVYNKKENKRTLVKTSKEEFDTEIKKTESRFIKNKKIGTNVPDFDIIDIDGKRLSKDELKGKVLVLNFWFVGCPPCEIESPLLNNLANAYRTNDDVVFISFARNNREELINHLKENLILYKVVPTDKGYIKTKFEINGYPVNIIVDRDGKYTFYSSGVLPGLVEILNRKITEALN